jgi:8-oxo-dGTP pyrophosphatase MutT (NUDIX family)
MSIRNAAKAFVIKENHILLNKCKNSTSYNLGETHPDEVYYDLPGGGQNQFETIEEAVIRECMEETGYNIVVERLAALYEEIVIDAELGELYPDYVHKIYFVFLCHPQEGEVTAITERDFGQITSEWIDINHIMDLNLHPNIIKSNFYEILNTANPIFFGSTRL